MFSLHFIHICISYESIDFDSQLYYELLLTMQDQDAFSFCGKQRKRKTSMQSLQRQAQIPQKLQPKNWREMSYRFERNLSFQKPHLPVYQSHYVNQKINKIDEQLTQNIKRRIELQKKLYKEKHEIRQKQNQKYFKQNYCKSDLQVTQTYTNMEKKTEAINTALNKPNQSNFDQTYFQSVQQKQTKNIQYLSKKQKKQKKYLVPDQVRIQKLLRLAKFPQIPQYNLDKLEQQCLQIMIHSQHSDIYYIMMVVSFHQQKYHNVRKYFREIQLYKIFQAKAYWVACQTQYELESYQLCLKFADICMKEISDVHLPRFVYLQAKSYQKIGNHINSIVCYNQVIKMKPKVAELYLERAMIYDKIGYPIQAKQDYLQYSLLEPSAREILRDKILQQKNEIKRKQMIKALAKIT